MPAHSIIFRQGDPGDCCFTILSGKVKVFKRGLSGQETDLSLLGTGDGFGEMALITGEARSANVETLEETHLLVIGKKQFDSVLKSNPNVSLAFIKQMSTGLLRKKSLIENEAEHQFKAPKFSWLDCLFIVAISIPCGIIFNFTSPYRINLIPEFWSDEKVPIIAPQKALTRYRNRSLFVDARPNFFFEREHIKGAINIPPALFDMMYMMEVSSLDKNKSIVVYGRTISSLYDEKVARKFVLRGHNNTMILKGGLAAWKKEEYPIT